MRRRLRFQILLLSWEMEVAMSLRWGLSTFVEIKLFLPCIPLSPVAWIVLDPFTFPLFLHFDSGWEVLRCPRIFNCLTFLKDIELCCMVVGLFIYVFIYMSATRDEIMISKKLSSVQVTCLWMHSSCEKNEICRVMLLEQVWLWFRPGMLGLVDICTLP